METIHSGKRYAFVTMCECPTAYLVVHERDGVHFRNDGTLEAMAEKIDRLEPEFAQPGAHLVGHSEVSAAQFVSWWAASWLAWEVGQGKCRIWHDVSVECAAR